MSWKSDVYEIQYCYSPIGRFHRLIVIKPPPLTRCILCNRSKGWRLYASLLLRQELELILG